MPTQIVEKIPTQEHLDAEMEEYMKDVKQTHSTQDFEETGREGELALDLYEGLDYC